MEEEGSVLAREEYLCSKHLEHLIGGQFWRMLSQSSLSGWYGRLLAREGSGGIDRTDVLGI